MWVVAITPAHVQFAPTIYPQVSAADSSQPSGRRRSRRSYPSQDGGDIGGLGQSLIAPAVNPNPKTQITEQNQGKLRKQQEEESQISGSDVLWALQQATAEKKRSSAEKRKKKMRIGLTSSAGKHTGETRLDYSKVRPLRVESEWAVRLDELETRLKELEETI